MLDMQNITTSRFQLGFESIFTLQVLVMVFSAMVGDTQYSTT